LKHEGDFLAQLVNLDQWLHFIGLILGLALYEGHHVKLLICCRWHYEVWLTATGLNTLAHAWLISSHHVELGSIMKASVLTVSVACWSLLYSSQGVIAVAFIFHTRLKDIKWNSIFDV
jgi:hypothetical protein